MTVPYVAGINVPGAHPRDTFSLEGSVTGEVADKRSGLIIQMSDRNKLPGRFHTLLTAFDTGLRSIMAVPLISKDRVIGAIHFRSTKSNAYSDQDLKLAENIASQIAGAIANVQLFTENRRTEENLREREEGYRSLVENAKDAIFTLSTTGKITSLNPAFETITGWSCTEWIGKPFAPLLHPADLPIATELFRRALQGEMLPMFELSVLLKSGGYALGQFTATPQIEKGRVKGILGIARDVTERKQAEEALETEKQRFQTLSEQAPFGLMMINKDGVFEYINPKFKELFGYDLSDVPNGKTWFRKAYPDPTYRHHVISDWLNDLESSKQGEKRLRVFTAVCKDGVKKIINFNSVQLETGDQLVACEDITERKHAEEALINTEERFRIAAESSSDLIWDWDILNGKLNWFGNIDERLGYNPGEFPRTIDAWEKIIHPDEHDRVMIALDQHLKMHKPYVEEYRVQRKDGTFCYWTDCGTAIWDEKGNPYKMVGACTDITDRKRAEEALRESEERYRTILENIEDGYYEVDLLGNFTFFNDSLCRMLGYSKDEMIGMGNQQYTDPENRKKLFQAFNEVYRTGEPTNTFDWEVIRKDGSKVYGEVSASLIKDSNGHPTGFRGIARDITERKEAEEALQESEKKFRVLTETAASGIFIHQGEKFVYVNPASEAMTGYSREELLTMDFWDLVHPDFRELVKQRAQARQQGKSVPSRYELKIITKNGEERWVDLAVGMIDFQGKPAILGTDFDITERKRAEEEMRALEEQLRQSQKIEAIGRLAGGIAHDFNNVLTVIKGYSQLSLLDLKESDPLWGNIQEIQKATQRATDLTRHLLAFSRRQILDLKVLDLNSLLKDLDKMLRRIIGEDIELSTLLANDLGRVKIDPGQIEQVILNLAVNARDAMPSGGKLLIETSSVELDGEYTNNHVGVIPGHYVRLSVSDTGVGMSKDVKEKIFEPFFTTKEKGKGTGLGLSTVYGIVKQSGGIIWVYSEPGHGTTFKIYLPRVEEALDAVNGRDGTDSLPGGSETVLLVEDEPLVRDLARRLLSQQGYTILEAADGGEALRIAQEYAGKKIHLLLTDVVMPRMGGKELAEQIKPLRPDIKVLYTSGYTDDAIVHHGVLDPGTHFLQKPFSLKTLSARCARCWTGKLDEGIGRLGKSDINVATRRSKK